MSNQRQSCRQLLANYNIAFPAASISHFLPATQQQSPPQQRGGFQAVFRQAFFGAGDDSCSSSYEDREDGGSWRRASWRNNASADNQRKKSVDEDIWRWTFETR